MSLVLRTILILCAALFVHTPVYAEKVGLVLSGGAARGLTHVGVLRALEEQNIKVDVIAGTSMGAIIGGLYAAGYSVDELEQLALTLDWAYALSDEPDRKDRPFRRKQDDRDFLVKQKLSFKDDGSLGLPMGIIQGQNLDLVLEELLINRSNIEDFDQLMIPFRAVGTDLATGKEVVFAKGHLPQALRASMSLPGLLEPVKIEGKLIADGGMANNLPISVAKAMGVDRVIAVDIGTPLMEQSQLKNVLSVLNQTMALLTRNNTDAQIETLEAKDLLIQPALEGYTVTDFGQAKAMIDMGYQSTMSMSAQLASFPKGKVNHHQFIAENQPPIIRAIRIENTAKVSDALIRHHIRQPVGEMLNLQRLQRDLSTLYGLEYFNSVHYRLEDRKADQATLVILAQKREAGTDYLRLGLNLSDDFNGQSTFNLGASFRMNGVNSLGAEWFTRMQLGDTQELFSEFYQPLAVGSPYFVSPWVKFSVNQISLMDDGDAIAEYRLKRFQYGLSLGREINKNGELRLNLGSGWGNANVHIGDPALDSYSFKEGFYELTYAFDTLDSLQFPTKGEELKISFMKHTKALGADESYRQWQAIINKVFSFDRNTFMVGGRYARTLDAKEIIDSSFQIGGALNLSGFKKNSMAGQNLQYARIVYYRRMSPDQVLPIAMPYYLGASLETGRIWNMDRRQFDTGTINAASIFVGVETPLGPLTFNYGLNTFHQNAVYLNLGHSF